VAFLVCYSRNPPDDHCEHKAIYLDQRFYELIFEICRSANDSYPILHDIAFLKYKAPTLIVSNDRLGMLDRELGGLAASGIAHPQIAEFGDACRRAIKGGLALTISGDMYPEL